MDALTHGLASYSLMRAIFPRAARVTVAAAILAGMVPDLDLFSRYASPTAYLIWHRAFGHSLAGICAIAVLFSSVVVLLSRGSLKKDSRGIVVLLCVAVGMLHIAMDLTQNEGLRVLSPFRFQRYSADWVAHFDLWILFVLLAGALLPQLLGLVTEEIGAKSKAPRGRIGAGLALVVVGLYVGGRGVLHGNAVAAMEARTYRGELPRRVAAYAESDSPMHWRGVVETERAMHVFDLDVTSTASFNPDAGVVSYKPEPSAALDTARNAEAARFFLQSARFPKASVEKTQTGFRVEIRDLANAAGTGGPYVMAVIETDPNGKVLNDELVWSRM